MFTLSTTVTGLVLVLPMDRSMGAPKIGKAARDHLAASMASTSTSSLLIPSPMRTQSTSVAGCGL